MNFIRLAFLALALLEAGHASAQTYPDHTVRILVGFTPGSATDVSARMFAQKLSDAWAVPVTVENLPGGGGSIGGERVARSLPDGYTLYWGANGAMTINPSLQNNPTFEPMRDLAPVARLELIALAKIQPGKLTFASPGTGTPQHIAGEMLKRVAGIDIVHVPYRGANFTDVIAGRVTMTFQNAGAILPTVREGKLRPLAVTSLKRSPNMPEFPTMVEAGVADFEATSWFGLLAPVGTPSEIVTKLHHEAVRIVSLPDMREKFALIGLDVVTDAPDAFAAIIRSDTQKWAKVIKEAGIKGE
jgi:tripartite-type tricarboxylate transporter receptor subunit TctC